MIEAAVLTDITITCLIGVAVSLSRDGCYSLAGTGSEGVADANWKMGSGYQSRADDPAWLPMRRASQHSSSSVEALGLNPRKHKSPVLWQTSLPVERSS